MTAVHIIILLASGMVAGFGGGLLGVGGGFIMAPVQFYVFTHMGVPADIAIKLAFGTSLLVILPTAASGAWRHSRKGTVRWKAAVIMGGCGLAFAFLGSTLAAHLPGEGLKMAFGAIVLLSGIRMLSVGPKATTQPPVGNPWLWFVWAIPLGLITGILGIGGGGLAIPIMVLALRFEIHQAVATSLAMMIFSSSGGAIGYIVNGLNVPNLPAYSIGYVNLLSAFLLAVTSVSMAQVGAIMAHKIPAKQLKVIFVLLLFYIGLKMLGVFDWLGLPI